MFLSLAVLKGLDVATTYIALQMGYQELNPLAQYVHSAPELMILGFASFTAVVSILYFSQPIIKGMASSREKALVETIYRLTFIALNVMMLLVVWNNVTAILAA